ncbi:MAG: M14 family metallopeptidase [Solirubrobacterales bacterium]
MAIAAFAALGAHASASVIGHSVDGRPIKVQRIGDPAAPTKVLVVGNIHGDEPQGIRIVDRLRRRYGGRLHNVDLWTIETVNPDGLAADTRVNAHGVDLNRNFGHGFDPTLNGGYESGPHPFSEPESRAVRGLARRVDFDLAIWYHQPWGETLDPCNESGAVARRYARLSGLGTKDGCDHDLPGTAIGWQHHRFGTAAFVVELAGGALSDSQVRRHARAVATLARDSER